tara:strand:+ start:309 stop:461 length:153 start_codon:yes stop_codon:yes gene_type:complete
VDDLLPGEDAIKALNPNDEPPLMPPEMVTNLSGSSTDNPLNIGTAVNTIG